MQGVGLEHDALLFQEAWKIMALGADDLRGTGGPLGISPRPGTHDLAEAIIAAGMNVGLPRRNDLNREDTTGIGYLNCNIKRGVRQSSAEAFLKPVRRRQNLSVS